MACNFVDRWTRNPAPVTVEVKIVEEQVIIQCEGYGNGDHQEDNEIEVIDKERVIYGKLCVKTDGSLFVSQGELEEPDDGSQNCKHIASLVNITSYPYVYIHIYIYSYQLQ